MITKHLQVCKSILLLAFAIFLFLFSNCSSYDPAIPEVEVTVTDVATLEFDKVGGSKTIKLKINSEWKVVRKTDADWIKVSPTNGIEGNVVLIVNVENNEGVAREGIFTIITSQSEKTITIKQEGSDGLVFDYATIKEIRILYAESGKQEWKIVKPLMLNGVIISDRTCGNRASQRDGYIQDDAGDGLAFRVNQSVHSFNMGDKLSINLQGAIVLYYGGILQINFSSKDVEVQAQNILVAPKEFSIEEILEGMYDGTLVKIKDVQFKDYKDLNYWEKGLFTNRTLENYNDANITIKTTKYASFKDETLPAGMGNIVGIMSLCNDDWQLVIRNLDDAKQMSTDAASRFTVKVPPVEATKIDVADFRSALKEGEVYTKDNFIEGEVLLNAYKGNVPDNTVYIADQTASITLLFSDKENILTHVPIGAKVKVSMKNVGAKVLNGLLYIGVDNSLSSQAVEIVEKKASNPLQPKEATMDEIVAGKYQSELVKLENVQFKEVDLKYADNPFVVNKDGLEVQVYTRRDAVFASDAIKKGMGPIVALVSRYNSAQLVIRSVVDLADMSGERFVDSFIAIDKNSITFEQQGGDENITIKANVDWTATSSESWLTITPKKGANDGVIKVTATKNESTERKANITITDGTITEAIVVTQEAKEPSVVKNMIIKELRIAYLNNGQEKWTVAEPLNLKGVVISDRIGGNKLSQRDGFMQDEAGDGLAFLVKEFVHSFDMGDELKINLQGATISKYEGALQVSFSTNSVEVEAKNVNVVAKELSINEILNGDFDATLVKIKDVQFKTYKNIHFYEGYDIATYRTLENCNDANITVKTTKYATFKNESLPAGKGAIVGIVSWSKGSWQIVIRNLDDVKEMSQYESSRCPKEEPPVTESKISVSGFRTAITGGKIFTEERYIEGEVLLNAYKGNVPDNTVYLADGTAGITLIFADKENILTRVPIGAKVKVNVKNAASKILNGLLHIGVDNSLSSQAVEIIEIKANSLLQPKFATMDEIVAGKYQSELVRVKNVQFKNVENRYGDSPFIINEALKDVEVYTRGNATFANDVVKEGMGSIVAVVSINNSPQMLIRSTDDLADMMGERFGTLSSFINSDKSGISFKNKGGEAIINITANVLWTVKSDQSWLTIAPNGGNINGTITATANKNEGKERKATITITDGTIATTVQVTQECVEASGSVASDLFFSEYIEGSSYNKYLEIYNGTGKTVDLSDYKVDIYVNGQSTAKYTELLNGKLENGSVIVLQNTKSTLYEGVTIESSAINFNGNDAIALVKISTDAFVDIFGTIGHDPGSTWLGSLTDFILSTKDRTLVRKPSIHAGITKNPKNGFPALAVEWIGYPIDTIDYLGSHTMN